jgi:hypothetical protein
LQAGQSHRCLLTIEQFEALAGFRKNEITSCWGACTA